MCRAQVYRGQAHHDQALEAQHGNAALSWATPTAVRAYLKIQLPCMPSWATPTAVRAVRSTQRLRFHVHAPSACALSCSCTQRLRSQVHAAMFTSILTHPALALPASMFMHQRLRSHVHAPSACAPMFMHPCSHPCSCSQRLRSHIRAHMFTSMLMHPALALPCSCNHVHMYAHFISCS